MDDPDTPPPPTLSDVARHAKVSLATADRVVNRRPGVRAATIERVEAAVRALGFERHAGAAALARRAGYRAVAILPRRSNPFVARLAAELAEAVRHEGRRRLDLAIVEIDAFSPERLAAAIRDAAAAADGIVVMGLGHPLVIAAIDAASAAGRPVVTLVSDVSASARHRYVGIDNRAAGGAAATLIGRFVRADRPRVLVLLGSRDLGDHRDRLDGFSRTLAARFPRFHIPAVAEGQDDPSTNRRAVEAALRRDGPFDAVYSAGAGVPGLVAALDGAGLRPVVVAHELTDETRPLVESGRIDALITQDPGHEARSAVRVLMGALAGTVVNENQERIRIEILIEANLPR